MAVCGVVLGVGGVWEVAFGEGQCGSVVVVVSGGVW